MIGSLFGILTGLILLFVALADGDPGFLAIAVGWTVVATVYLVANLRDTDPYRRRSSGGGTCGGCGGGCGGSGCGGCGGCGGD